MTRGVPQGSCLSPLLFNIFVHELPAVCGPTTETWQFADDVTNSCCGTDPYIVLDKLKDSFTSIKEYCVSHELTVNTAKTQLIILKSAAKKISENLCLSIDDCKIEPTKAVKLLGLNIDRHLTFGTHIDAVVNKCKALTGVLARAAPCLSKELRKMFYVSMIRTHIEYASVVFSTASKTQHKLDTRQRICTRIICGAPKDAHAAPLMSSLNIDSLEARRKSHIVDLCKQIVAEKIHPMIQDMF